MWVPLDKREGVVKSELSLGRSAKQDGGVGLNIVDERRCGHLFLESPLGRTWFFLLRGLAFGVVVAPEAGGLGGWPTFSNRF